ncbi:MAG: inner membrane-spanning protein YciB [Pseudomonadota bacterium]
MAERKVNGWVKFGLELGPVIAFFVAYTRLKDRVFDIGGTDYDGFIVVTAAFIPVLLVATGVLWALTGKLSRLQLLTAVVVVVFGGLSVWLNDERFFKMKPTILYAAFAVILAFGLMRGQSYLAAVMEEMMPLEPEGWMILTRRFCLLFFVLAAANEAVWRLMSTDAWVNFKTFGLTAALFVFLISQSALIQRYSLEDQEN